MWNSLDEEVVNDVILNTFNNKLDLKNWLNLLIKFSYISD